MARQRNYRAEYLARQARALANEGKTYGQVRRERAETKARAEGYTGGWKGRQSAVQREKIRIAENSPLFNSIVWDNDEIVEEMTRGRYISLVNLYYRAFHTEAGKRDYTTKGPKAKWFVEIANLMGYDEWAARYPMGVRN